MSTETDGVGREPEDTESSTAQVDASADPTAAAPAGAETAEPAPAEATEFVDPEAAAEAETGAESEATPGDAESDVAQAPVNQSAGKRTRRQTLEAEGDVAADFLEALLDICDIDGDIDVDIDGDRAAVSIVDSDEGRVPRRLVGPDGKVLEALQELTRLAVQTETGERSRLMLDVAGHRASRKDEIVEIARGVIADVKSSGDQVEMEPMTAFERKIVHDEVLAAGLRSESDGVEPRRFVVVLPALDG